MAISDADRLLLNEFFKQIAADGLVRFPLPAGFAFGDALQVAAAGVVPTSGEGVLGIKFTVTNPDAYYSLGIDQNLADGVNQNAIAFLRRGVRDWTIGEYSSHQAFFIFNEHKGTESLQINQSTDQATFAGILSAPAYVTTPSVVPASSGGATTINWGLSSVFTHTLTENVTYSFSNTVSGQTIMVAVTNTASNFTVAWPTISWVNGAPPVQTTGAHTDIYTITKIGSTLYGSYVQGY